jgi:hypothetical protein
MREGVVASGVGWASVEVPYLDVHPLNELKSSTIHTSKNIRLLFEYSHDQL